MMPAAAPYVPRLRLYQDWLRDSRGLAFDSYAELWRWSVTDLDAFWQSIWEHSGIASPTPHRAVLAEERMPGAVWFPGAQVNYAREVLRHVDAAQATGMPAIVAEDELGTIVELSWPELKRQVASVALALRSLGVRRGDRVAAYLPNRPETIVAFLACASLGADLERVRARHGYGGGRRPVPPARPGAADRRRRRALRQPAARPQPACCGSCANSCRACAGCCC